jgi:hypothetical protein
MNVKTIFTLLFFACISVNTYSQTDQRSFFGIKIYHYETPAQEKLIDNHLETAFIPALHRYGIKHIGVFKPVNNNTLQDKLIYVLIPFSSAQRFVDLDGWLAKDTRYIDDGKPYLETNYSKPAYSRIENIFLQAFKDMPLLKVPSLKNEPSKRIYELRSYEGPTESKYLRKVHMFNEGGEILLFDRLNFNALFYGSVIAGSRMPNLMYMTSFEDMESRDQHWKEFFASPEWEKLSAIDYYKNSVSKSDIILLTPTAYSEL